MVSTIVAVYQGSPIVGSATIDIGWGVTGEGWLVWAGMSDELAVRNVVARLAMLADEGNLEEYVDLFTEDARWDMPGGELQGRENLLAGGHRAPSGGDGRPG